MINEDIIQELINKIVILGTFSGFIISIINALFSFLLLKIWQLFRIFTN